ncbi:hypothetical protein DPMN_072308 [Dreissena polymorpha]|uniref:Uncharacterized protein n=1 Tax=Dreissena polymorpha TaxID=45954 RepID=A0A9D3Z4B2_DREPO|nr:hypothetical protein DPMN_072308 [Dreissena polymorpha]
MLTVNDGREALFKMRGGHRVIGCLSITSRIFLSTDFHKHQIGWKIVSSLMRFQSDVAIHVISHFVFFKIVVPADWTCGSCASSQTWLYMSCHTLFSSRLSYQLTRPVDRRGLLLVLHVNS